MKIALGAALALPLCAFLLAGDARAQTETGPAPAPEVLAPAPGLAAPDLAAPGLAAPGIIVSPPALAPQRPHAPSTDTQLRSCPDTGRKLELVS
jgi:hypothetical protein